MSDHAIVCGDGRLAGRVAQRLHRLNVPVAVITEADHLDLPDAVMVVQGDPRVPDVLREAGVERAESVVLAGDGDVENLHTSLIVRELAPQARIVARA
ncbi:MAG TPA: NAD-binding protein, partial [Marmoricola sp.]|nr:NAD-binding protein [Marmoricola sp.]